jgi:hypothetical protein
MLRCLRMGLAGRASARRALAMFRKLGLDVEERSRRSWAEAGLTASTLSGMGSGLGGGVHSTAVCRGP